jgi:hypothetical protein
MAVRQLIDDAFERAKAILGTDKPLQLESAAELLAKETLSEDDQRPFTARLTHIHAPQRPIAGNALQRAEAVPP